VLAKVPERLSHDVPTLRVFTAGLFLTLCSFLLPYGFGQAGPRLTPGNTHSTATFTVSIGGGGYVAIKGDDTAFSFEGSLKAVVESATQELMRSGGGSIVFLAGTFDLGADWFEFDGLAHITFSGQGIDITTIVNNADADTDTEPFDFVRSDFITIRDMTVIAGGPPRSTSDAIDFDGGDFITIERVKVEGSRGRGIVFDGKGGTTGETHADHNVIRSCIVAGVPGDGIELLASSYNLIEGCIIRNVGGSGINIAKSSDRSDQPNKPSNGNRIIGNVIEGVGADGIRINGSSENVIVRNRVTNSSSRISGRDGIRIMSIETVRCDENLLWLNVVSDERPVPVQKYGLHIRDAECVGTHLSDNIIDGFLIAEIRDNGDGTIYSSDVTLLPVALEEGGRERLP
jgi:parallel beta-helix repeat protein